MTTEESARLDWSFNEEDEESNGVSSESRKEVLGGLERCLKTALTEPVVGLRGRFERVLEDIGGVTIGFFEAVKSFVTFGRFESVL